MLNDTSMSSNYQSCWTVMNDLEQVTTKIVSAREIIDAATEAIERHEYSKAETLMSAAYEFLGYYLDEFDERFKLAWKETVVKQKEEEELTLDLSSLSVGYGNTAYSTHSSEDNFQICHQSWSDFWATETIQDKKHDAMYSEKHSEDYYDYTRNDPDRENPFDQTSWSIPIEQHENGDFFLSFPDELLKKMNWKENDQLEWVIRDDGSFELRKVQQ